jgi:squalene-hopene/tetraprenyl-beta-curcumene cyclase
MVGKAHVSRRGFISAAPVAVLPLLWPAARLVKLAVDCAGATQCLRESSAKDRTKGQQGVAGVTALATMAVLRGARDRLDSTSIKGLKSLESFVQPDGGIYTPGRRLENYETCLAMMCLAEANRNGRYDRVLHAAEGFLKARQCNEGQGKETSQSTHGGIGYSARHRPDLLNTAILIDAITRSRPGSDDKAVARAVVFVSRRQNLGSGADARGLARDGGFRGGRGSSKVRLASAPAKRRSTSSGLMTCYGLRSLLLGGAEKKDSRVAAALAWIGANYDLSGNPGMGNAGLYHYYHILAKTLSLAGVDSIEDASGKQHKWRDELCNELVRRQRPDGCWINENGYWMENDATVATANALLAYSYC